MPCKVWNQGGRLVVNLGLGSRLKLQGFKRLDKKGNFKQCHNKPYHYHLFMKSPIFNVPPVQDMVMANSSGQIPETLFETNIKLLKKDALIELCKKYKMPFSGTKADLVGRLESLMRDEGQGMEEAERSPNIQLYDEILRKIEYRNQADLIDKLCRMNQTELRKMVRSKGITGPCRKMQLVSHVASFIMRDKMPTRDGITKVIKLKDLENSNAASLQLLLQEQGEPKCFGRIEELKQRVYACMVRDAVLKSEDYVSELEDIEELLTSFIACRRADRILASEVRRRLESRGIPFSLTDSPERMVELLAESFQEELVMFSLQPNEEEQNIKLEDLAKQWIEEEMEFLCKDSILEKLPKINREELISELEARNLYINDLADDQQKTVLKKAVTLELNLVNRAITLVAAKLDRKLVKLDKTTMFSVLNLDPQFLKRGMKGGRTLFIHEEFRVLLAEKLRPHMLSLFQRQMAKMKEIKKELDSYKKRNEAIRKESGLIVEDSAITISVVFGGSEISAQKSLCNIRCLLDHLQSAPYSPEQPNESDTEDSNLKESQSIEEKHGISIVPFFINSNLEIFHMTSAQLLSLDVQMVNLTKLQNRATQIKTLEELGTELGKSNVILSLLNGIHESKWMDIKNLLYSFESKSIGSSIEKTQNLSNKYKTLQILRKNGYPTLPSFTMSMGDLADVRNWVQRFRKWAVFTGLDRKNRSFAVRSVWDMAPAELHMATNVSEAISFSVELAEKGFDVIIQPFLHHTKAVQFSCAVIECSGGPVALVPTEIEITDESYMRPLSGDTYCHTPPSLDFEKMQAMRLVACQVFKDLGLRDYAIINGWLLTDNSEKVRNQIEELPLPRPMPDLKEDNYDDERNTCIPELERAFERAVEDREKDLDQFIESYESQPWTPEGIHFTEFLGKYFEVDGEEPIDLVKAMDLHVHHLKHRNDEKEIPDPDLSSLPKHVQDKLLSEEEVGERETISMPVDFGNKESERRKEWIQNICNGKDYSVLISSIDYTGIFEHNSYLFVQASICGLSHSSILRHIVDHVLVRTGLEPLTVYPKEPILYNPLFPETYDTEYIPEDELQNPKRSIIRNAHINKFPRSNAEQLREILEAEKIHLKAPKPRISPVPINAPAFVEKPTQVWVLCGGDGAGAQSSFTSGINTWLKLRRSTDLQVYPFLLEPAAYTAGSRERLRELMERRRKTLELGVPEEDLFQELKLEYIKNPELEENDMPWRPVWALSYDAALHPTIDEAIESARRDLGIAGMARHMRLSKVQAFEDIRLAAQKDLYLAGVDSVGSLWGGSHENLGPSSRQISLDMFALEAMIIGAVIYLDVSGDMARDGTLQSFLESFKLIYTGCNGNTSGLCGDKYELAKAISEFEAELISSLPQRVITAENIKEAADNIAKATNLFSEASSWLAEPPSICIKPISGSFNEGVARLSDPIDLSIYADALKNRKPIIQGSLLSGEHRDVVMPNPAPLRFIVEPYLETGKVEFKDGICKLQGDNPWIEVSFGLLGDMGQMWAMTPSLILDSLETQSASTIDRLLFNHRPLITPVPQSICKKDIIRRARQSVEKIADRLSLRGVARVDAFLNTETAQLVVIEVDTCPSVSMHSPLLQQAALDEPPMYPNEVFENVLDVAISPRTGPGEEAELYQIEKFYEPLMDPVMHMQREIAERRMKKGNITNYPAADTDVYRRGKVERDIAEVEEEEEEEEEPVRVKSEPEVILRDEEEEGEEVEQSEKGNKSKTNVKTANWEAYKI